MKQTKKHGFGIINYNNGDVYIGQFSDGKREGYGKYIVSNGDIYQGEFKNDTSNGFLEYKGKNLTKQGYAKNFVFQNGELVLNRPEQFIEGIFDLKSHCCMAKYVNNTKKSVYEGEMVNYISHGWGITNVKDRYIFKGLHANGHFNGYGEVYNPDGSRIFGIFKNSIRNGISLAFCKDGKVTFGKYVDDYRHGPFIVSQKGLIKVELWNYGYKSKLVEKIDAARAYFKCFYPEFEWLQKFDIKKVVEIFQEVKAEEFNAAIPIPPIMNNNVKSFQEEVKSKENTIQNFAISNIPDNNNNNLSNIHKELLSKNREEKLNQDQNVKNNPAENKLEINQKLLF